MRKLKTWQLVLLIIFYPVGIIYFICWVIYKILHADKSKNANVTLHVNESIPEDYITPNSVDLAKPVKSDIDYREVRTRTLWLGGIDFDLLDKVKVGDKVILVQEDTDEHENPVKVLWNGEILGYLSGKHKVIQKKIYDRLADVHEIYATINEIKHTSDFDGCSIRIMKKDYLYDLENA